ncbi:MAG: hypothetical protein JF612_06675 [Planctomycetia bacterium]|nr:hypothetical protein [Planctomycetia bacterium]
MPPVDYAKKAGNMQLMGILSMVLGFCCCSPAGLILGIIVMVQAPATLAMLQQIGNPPDLVGKVNTGKTFAIIGLVLSALRLLGDAGYTVVSLMNR